MGINELFRNKKEQNGLSIVAERITLQRFAETMLPGDIRTFSDPYAVWFIDPEKMIWANEHPEETRKITEEIGRMIPGWNNAIRGRIRYFDDVVLCSLDEGFTQLVIFGAGYDTRAYRIGDIKGRMRVFEVDQQEVMVRKKEIIRQIFGKIPDPVSFIPLDMTQRECWNPLEKVGWSPEAKTLFLLEGLVMYLPAIAVESLLGGISCHGCAESTVLFDFVPLSFADGSSDAEGGQNIREWTIRFGEPVLSGFDDGEVIPFLAGIGYSRIRIIKSQVFADMFYQGKNAGRKVSGLMSLAYATVSTAGDRTS